MTGYPRENVKGKGFWDGGSLGHAKNDQGAGRAGGFPGTRKPRRVGIKTDIEYPPETPAESEPKA